MSTPMIVLIVLLTLIVILDVPIVFGVGALCIGYLLMADYPLTVVPQKIASGISDYLFVAIPFFYLAGALFNEAGITKRLVAFIHGFVGHTHGALGHATIATNIVMSGMSGTAAADTAASGSVLIPEMIKEKYPRGLAAALTASASTIGAITPPSVGMVILSGATGVSVGRLFLGGVVPGLLMGLSLFIIFGVVARKHGYGGSNRRASVRKLGVLAVRSLPALFAPVIILGGIVGGIVTPTEASVVAVFYAALLGIAYRSLTLDGWRRALKEVVKGSSTVLLLLAVFNLVGFILAAEQIPQAVTDGFLGLTDNKYVFLLLVNILLFVIAIPVEPVPMLVLIAPVLLPVAESYGIDPVHFAVVFMLNTTLGAVTPPVGANMFIASVISGCTMGEFTRAVWPYVSAIVVVLLVITYFPVLVTILPDLLMGGG